MKTAIAGLSPLARGTLFDSCCRVIRLRFIPAGAGNTAGCVFPALYMAVYPRWRGEHRAALEKQRRDDGLSPLARGTLRVDFAELIFSQFIPAGAGNTTPE